MDKNKLEKELGKLEEELAPTAEMQLGETDVQQLVKDSDFGGRSTEGVVGKVMLAVGLTWVIFQLWYASPLPFALRFGVFNDTEARSIHLAIGLFLAFLAFPATKKSPRDHVPVLDWLLAAAGAFSALYLIIFYQELALRPGNPTQLDIVVGVVGILVLLEATRRAVGLPMAVLAVLFLAYTILGPYLPDVIAHKGASIPRLVSHMWMVTEGVFGIALGVSVSFIFVFVLFGTLLDRAGGGNYMMQVSFALLGHLRGGPAKVAVVSSALNGFISGSSVSNVVSGGIFTIPLMKRAGYGGVKAAAIETSSSVNGQIMPPVMGAAAFLMVEYVGIPYADIVKHAFIPAVISYIALFYIVHLEALKLGILPAARERDRTMRDRLVSWGLGLSGTIAVMALIYYIALGAKALLGEAAPYLLGALLALAYVWSTRVAARQPDLPTEIDVQNPVLPPTWPTVKAGLHFLIPIGVLIWCLMVEELSPGLSAFWGVVTQVLLRSVAAVRGRPAGCGWRLQRRRPQHDRHRGGYRLRRHHRRRDHADGARPAHDRLRRVRLAGQHPRHAGVHRVRLPGAGTWRADHRQLHPGRHADGAGDRRARRAVRAGDPADRGAPVRLLLRDHGRHHAARGPGELRRRSHRQGRPDRGRHPGLDLRGAHRGAAVHLDLQPGAAADRRAQLGRGAAGGRCLDAAGGKWCCCWSRPSCCSGRTSSPT